jgi:hypothetical protein
MTATVARPGDGLLQPLPLAALALLALNDQVLKAAWPGPVTGILSDVAGLLVVPIALQAGREVVAWATGRWRGPSMRVLGAAIVVVGVGFVAVQLVPAATHAYRLGLGVAQWPFRALVAAFAGAPIPAVAPVLAVGDAGDLLALPVLAVTWWLGLRRVRAAVPAGPTLAVAPAAGHPTPAPGRDRPG